MATVVTPHSASQSAMARRSQELAPKRRTFAGSAAASAAAEDTRSAGTQTMCISAWTSIPAAFGLSTGRVTGCARGGRDAGLGWASLAEDLAWAGRRLCRLMVSAPVEEWGQDSRRGTRGAQEMRTFPNGIDASTTTDARHQWQGRRLSGQVI